MLDPIRDEVNPFRSPLAVKQTEVRAALTRGFWRRHWLVILLLLLPFLASNPLHYWVFHLAGGWLVSTDVEPEQRRFFLFHVWIAIQFFIAVLAWFPASVILWRSRIWSPLPGLAAVVLGILLIPALLALALLFQSWLQFG